MNDKISECVDKLKQVEDAYFKSADEKEPLFEAVSKLEQVFEKLTKEERGTAARTILSNANRAFNCRAFAASFGLYYSGAKECLDELLDLVRSGEASIRERYVLLRQAVLWGFVNSTGVSHESDTRDAFSNLAADYVKAFFEDVPPPKKRNRSGPIVVLASQFLALQHGPTQTSLLICDALRQLGKEVSIINTRVDPSESRAFVYNCVLGNFIPEFRGCGLRFHINEERMTVESTGSEGTQIEYRGNVYPFYQFADPYDLEEAKHVLRRLATSAPELVISIGGRDLFAEAVARLMPTVTMPCNFTVPLCVRPYAAVTCDMTEQVIETAVRRGFERERLIQSSLPYLLRGRAGGGEPQKVELEMEKGNVAVAIVGGRLDDEVNEECVSMMRQFLSAIPTIRFVFIGSYEKQDWLENENSDLAIACLFAGYQKDVFGILEQCAFFFNPPRIGGGFSALEALSVGLPALTLPFGDVSYVVGKDFQFKDVHAMTDYMKKVLKDAGFAEQERQKALKRAGHVANPLPIVKSLLDEMELKTCKIA